MEKKPEVDGRWKEVDAKDCVAEMEAIQKSEIFVLTSLRMEIGGEDKVAFSKKFDEYVEKYSAETEGMTDEQKSFFVIRKMIIE